jgi:hypothetical protein
VLWIHGPQPITHNSSESTMLDLVHSVCLYNLQIAPGPDLVSPALKTEDVSNLITCETLSHKSATKDVKALVSSWQKGSKTLSIKRCATTTPPQSATVMNQEASAQVTSLWAMEQVAKLIENGRKEKAQELAANYGLVSPVTGAIVLANPNDYAANRINPGAFRNAGIAVSSGAPGASVGGLVGAPVDPRYGQSNEVGQMAVFGYDSARDVVRLLTALSLLISVMLAAHFLRSIKPITGMAVLKATVLLFAIPIVVHFIGTFMINNFGGLGGGL